MGVQQQLLEKLGQSLVVQFRDSIEQVKASGRTSQSIHAVATDSEVDILADRHIWALEDGRSPTSSGASASEPNLFDRIKEWMQYRSAFSGLEGKEKDSVAYAITKKIHREGWRPTLDKPLTNVIDKIDVDVLLRELVASQATIYNDRVVKSVKDL